MIANGYNGILGHANLAKTYLEIPVTAYIQSRLHLVLDCFYALH